MVKPFPLQSAHLLDLFNVSTKFWMGKKHENIRNYFLLKDVTLVALSHCVTWGKKDTCTSNQTGHLKALKFQSLD